MLFSDTPAQGRLTKAQKSASFLVELGNGDIFLFAVGTGSAENLFAIQPRFAKVDKVFVSHLHSDHFGDLDALWVGGRAVAATRRFQLGEEERTRTADLLRLPPTLDQWLRGILGLDGLLQSVGKSGCWRCTGSGGGRAGSLLPAGA